VQEAERVAKLAALSNLPGAAKLVRGGHARGESLLLRGSSLLQMEPSSPGDSDTGGGGGGGKGDFRRPSNQRQQGRGSLGSLQEEEDTSNMLKTALLVARGSSFLESTPEQVSKAKKRKEKQSKAKQSKAKQSKAKQSKAKQNKTKQNNPESNSLPLIRSCIFFSLL
jgi:hypothetical protein